MIPDPATIARRRHLVTIIVRSLIALFGAWVLWGAAVGLGAVLQPMYMGGPEYLVAGLWNFLAGYVPSLLLALVMFFFEKRLVRWIVPTGDSGQLCSKCGYSLKDLKSPICPECGTNLRP